jgi:hypothetical protein
MAAVALLGVCLGALLGLDAFSAWQRVSEAQRQLRMNAVSGVLVRAAGAIAAERGLVNGLLADPAHAPAEARAAVMQQRETAEAALAAAFAANLAQDTTAVASRRAALNDLRAKVKRASAGAPAEARPAPAWFAAATEAIDAVVALRRAVDAAGEVKALAQETRRSTERISERIGAIELSCPHAIGGITGAVGELDGIATSVASAIEQQSSATAAIAEAVHRSSEAASRVAKRVEATAETTGQCEQAAAGTATISREVAEGVNNLKSALVRLMRTRVEELDRRQEHRIAVTLKAELRARGRSWPGEIIDLSPNGLRFVPNEALPVHSGDTAELSCAGLPAAAIRVVAHSDTAVHMAFVFATAEQKEAMTHAVAALAHGRQAA